MGHRSIPLRLKRIVERKRSWVTARNQGLLEVVLTLKSRNWEKVILREAIAQRTILVRVCMKLLVQVWVLTRTSKLGTVLVQVQVCMKTLVKALHRTSKVMKMVVVRMCMKMLVKVLNMKRVTRMKLRKVVVKLRR